MGEFSRYSGLVQSPAGRLLILIMLAAAVWVAYSPGLGGPYVFDDFENITGNKAIAVDSPTFGNLLSAAYSKPEQGFGRPIAMLSFAINYLMAGRSLDPVVFKATNVIIHCLNAVLVFFLALALFRLRPLSYLSGDSEAASRRAVLAAMVVTAVWALHPLQLTSVLYTVQRMTSMAAFFVFSGLLVFVLGRKKLESRPGLGLTLMSAGLAAGTGLGLLCKENAVLLPALAGTVEMVFFSRSGLGPRTRRGLAILYISLVGLPILAGALYASMNPEFILGSYEMRNFSPMERILTEFRVLFFYVSLLAFPVVSRFGLYHDDFGLSTGLLAPPSTLFAVAAGIGLIAWTVVGLCRRSIWAFGVAWFLVGHVLESTILGLELVHEHRNYLPSFGLAFIAVYYAGSLLGTLKFDRRTATGVALSIVLVLGFVTHTRAQAWSSRGHLFETLVRHHPTSYRALSGLAVTMMEEKRDARDIYNVRRDAARVNPTTVAPLIELGLMVQVLLILSRSEENGRPVSMASASDPIWTSDASLDRGHLLAVDRAVSKEISRRLERNRIHVETVYALWTAQQCALDGHEHCLRLTGRLLEWHEAALEALPPKAARRALLELSMAKLFALDGDIGQALVYADQAIGTAAGHPRYKAQKGVLLVLLGDLDGAARIADEIEQQMDWRRTYVSDLEVLRQMIASRRAQTSKESSEK